MREAVEEAVMRSTGDYDPEAIRWSILQRINSPWFDSGGDSGTLQCVRRCYLLVEGLPYDGSNPRDFLVALMLMGDGWFARARHPSTPFLVSPLLQYNAALVHSVLLEALED